MRKRAPKIFGTIHNPLSPAELKRSEGSVLYGAESIVPKFYQALLEHGTFDEYHFFVKVNTDASLEKLRKKFSGNENIKIKKIEKLPLSVQNAKYSVFFTAGPRLRYLAYLRSQYAGRYFPICGLTHSMGYQSILDMTIFGNFLAELYPFDSIICTSAAVRKAFRNLNLLVKKSFLEERGISLECKARLDQLPLGIDADGYGKIDKADARNKLALPKNKVILLYFGRFSVFDKMDLFPLLVAFKNLLLKNKNLLLLLAGRDAQGGYAAKLKKLAVEMGIISHVRFSLDPPLEVKRLLYSASDIFVSPSDNIQESFGLTVLEAMASGLPAVVSDWDGYKDTVIHNKTGFKVPTYWANCSGSTSRLSWLFWDFHRDHLSLSQSVCVDVKKMIEYLSKLIKEQPLRRRFGIEARKRVLDIYDWRVLIPSYERLWTRLSTLSENYKIERKKTKILVPKHFFSFQHYATALINKNTPLKISPEGILAVKTRKFPHIFPEIQHLISIQMIFITLTFLLKKRVATAGEIQNHVKKMHAKIPPDSIKYTIMWLLKKNLLILK